MNRGPLASVVVVGVVTPSPKPVPQRVVVQADFAVFGESQRLVDLNPDSLWKKREVGLDDDTLGELVKPVVKP